MGFFLLNSILIVFLAFRSTDIEANYRSDLNRTINHINANENVDNDCQKMKGKLLNFKTLYNLKTLIKFCHIFILKAISTIFNCCGVNGPNDFTNSTIALECCHSDGATKMFVYQDGCANKSVASLMKLIFIASVVIWSIELFLLIMIPFLICSLRKVHDDSFGN